MTVGGDKLDYNGEPSYPNMHFLNTKIFPNSVISDTGNDTTFSTAYIKKYYLESLMKKYQ